ncbi:MAG: glutamine amidotransferase [Cyanobacteria bacterium]|nr:glutamine amidotransferase [Cyanobacteriota bacterium]
MHHLDTVLRLVHLYPDFLGSYGQRGNAQVLSQRCRWRGIAVERLELSYGEAIPSQADLYLLAGGHTAGLAVVAEALRQQHGLRKASERGAVILAIGSGLHLLGESIELSTGERIRGLGLLPLQARPSRCRRFGPVVGQPLIPIESPLLGFEDHQMTLSLPQGSQPIASLQLGEGNGGELRHEGLRHGRVWGTNLRGPVLALNPSLADLLLVELLGVLAPLPLLAVEHLRERFLRELPATGGAFARR